MGQALVGQIQINVAQNQNVMEISVVPRTHTTGQLKQSVTK